MARTSTLSDPSARAASAAETAESIPPDKPSTAPHRKTCRADTGPKTSHKSSMFRVTQSVVANSSPEK